MTSQAQLSKVEKTTAGSDCLRGNVASELAAATECFTRDTAQLLRRDGVYQQDDRDRRKAVQAGGTDLPKVYSMMVRTKVPGGKLTGRQFLTHLDLCDELGDATLRITARQGLQLHGVPKRAVRQAIRRINQAQLTTLGACGDVGRNVMCCPAPYRQDPVRGQIQELADRLSAHLLPRTSAYREIWLADPHSGEHPGHGKGQHQRDVEPLYGSKDLPRKFKIGIALPGDNCIDVYAQDLGLLAIGEDFDVIGYNLVVGGGMGVTPSNNKTFPALARPLAFVVPEDIVDVSMAIVKIFRDFGNRSDRKRARLKYLIAEWGLESFKAKVEDYCGHRLAPPRPAAVWDVDDHIGWHEQGDGRWFYGLNVENGRIADRSGLQLKSALREICRSWQPGVRLTPQQSVLLTDIGDGHRMAIEDVLRRRGVKLGDELSNVRRCSIACVALPTCPMAITESERVLPEIVDALEVELAKLRLHRQAFTIRMTGCPNGCSRPYNADIGLVGRGVGTYAIYLGGRRLGDRLGFVYRDKVPLDEIVPTLVPVFICFKNERQGNQSLGDFCHSKRTVWMAADAERRAVVK